MARSPAAEVVGTREGDKAVPGTHVVPMMWCSCPCHRENRTRFLTTDEASAWCVARQLRVTAARFLDYDLETVCYFSAKIEERASRVIALGDHMLPAWDAQRFSGALLWIRERGIWGDYSESSAELILRKMRLGVGEVSSLDERPAHLFEENELSEMHSFLLVPLLFGWDVFLVPEGLGYFYFCSHDAVLELIGSAPGAAQPARERLRDWGLEEDRDWYPRFVGR